WISAAPGTTLSPDSILCTSRRGEAPLIGQNPRGRAGSRQDPPPPSLPSAARHCR
ncbi:Hypothetical predicted protein, partial [Marmota monax]